MEKVIQRRDFIKKSAVGIAGLTMVPGMVLGKRAGTYHKAPNDKLNIAAIGIGGMGATNLKHMESENK
jgi:hypothetical protein